MSRLQPTGRLASLALLVAVASCSGGGADAPTAAAGTGRLTVQLTDAPFPYDSVRSVDMFVVRADAKREDADSAEATRGVEDGDKGADGWVTIAEPKAKLELTSLRNGVTAALGTASIPAGTYKAFRLIIDPAQSSLTLRNGTVLTSTSSPSIRFPSAGRSGVKIQLTQPVTVPEVAAGAAPPVLLIDFDLDASFAVRGNSLARDGLTFKPGIKATVR